MWFVVLVVYLQNVCVLVICYFGILLVGFAMVCGLVSSGFCRCYFGFWGCLV